MAYLGLKGFASEAFWDAVWFEGVPCGEVWHEGVKLFPDGRTRVRDLVLELPEDEYWAHAVYAVGRLGASEGCHIKVEFGGRVWMLYASFGGYALLRAVDGVFRFGVEDGLLLQDCEVGAVAQVSAVVPEHEGEVMASFKDATVEQLCEVPWLAGTRLSCVVGKGRKRTNARWDFAVVGRGSGCVHIEGWGQITGHKRGDWSVDVWAREMGVHSGRVRAWEDGYVSGDTGVLVRMVSYNGGTYIHNCRLVFPGFTRSWGCKVLGVTLWRD